MKHPRTLRASPWKLTALAVGLSVVATAAAPDSAMAVDKNKAAWAMAAKAKVAFEAGDHRKAADLYEGAWRLQPSELALLYSAARAAHTGGDNERARQLFQRVIDAEGAPTSLRDKAVGYLAEIRSRDARLKAAEADRSLRGGQAAVAAAQYEAAVKLAPGESRYRFLAGKAWMKAGDKERARAHLQAYLAKAPQDAPERAEAQAWLGQATGSAKGGKPPQPPPNDTAATPTPTPPEAAKSPETRDHPLPAVPLIASGVAIVSGALLFGLATSDATRLQDQLSNKNSAGLITGIDRDTALQESASIGTRKTIGAVIAGLGVGAVALTLVLGPKHKDEALLWRVGPRSVHVAWSWR